MGVSKDLGGAIRREVCWRLVKGFPHNAGFHHIIIVVRFPLCARIDLDAR
jgi:hypothetical protein